MSVFFDVLAERSAVSRSRLCVGLDPRAPDAAAAAQQAQEVILRTSPFAAAFKANAAFYECHGPAGMEALIEVVAAVPEDIPVIVDAKRGDIASTGAAYAAALYDVVGAGAVTVNAFMGRDAVDPFLAHPGRGIFVLCRTSNPSAADIQDLATADGTVAETTARLAAGWAGPDRIGLVAGATVPEGLDAVRAAAPESWILCPGLGAQQGEPRGLGVGLRSDGSGLLVNVSRAISQAADPAAEAESYRDLLAALEPEPSRAHSLAERLHEAGCVQFGEFTLRSGLVSPVYADLRRIIGDTGLLRWVAAAYGRVLSGVAADRLAAVPLGGMPIATAVSLHMDRPLIWPRPLAKGHGTGSRVEGVWQEGDRVVLIDDVVTSGTSAVGAAGALREAGLVVEDLAVLIDRRTDEGHRTLTNAGITVHAVTDMQQVVDDLARSGRIDAGTHASVSRFLTTA